MCVFLFVCCPEYQYDANFSLTTQELIYYYTISTRTGIFGNLLEKFLKEARYPYSALPLVRHSKLQPACAAAWAKRSAEIFEATELVAKATVAKPIDFVNETTEVMTRPGLKRTDVDEHGTPMIWIDSSASIKRKATKLKNVEQQKRKKRS